MFSVSHNLSLFVQVQQQIASEYEHVKALTQTLQLFRSDSHVDRPIGKLNAKIL